MDLREVKISKSNGRHPWELARCKVVTDLVRRFVPHVKNQETELLDIGCGDTWLIEQLSKTFNKAKFTAVDIAFTKELLEEYRARLNPSTFAVYESLEEAFENNPKKIDLVLLLDVIEHIEDDISFLKWIQSFTENINRDTYFLITVPAFQSLFCQHDIFLGHYRRYTNKSLIAHIDDAGLESIKAGYFFSSLLAPRFIVALKERLSNSTKNVKGVGDWKRKPTDFFVKAVLWADYKIAASIQKVGISLPGLSNYVLCKKKAR